MEECLPESANGLSLTPDRVSAIMCLNFPYLPPLWEATGLAFSMEGCIPMQNVAVPCPPAGEGSAGTHTSQIHLVSCPGGFYVSATSVYSAVRCSEVLHYCQFLPEKERQNCKAGDPMRGDWIPDFCWLGHCCSVCDRKEGLWRWGVL